MFAVWLYRLQELVRQLQSEKMTMLSTIDQLESQNRQLQDESKRLKSEVPTRMPSDINDTDLICSSIANSPFVLR